MEGVIFLTMEQAQNSTENEPVTHLMYNITTKCKFSKAFLLLTSILCDHLLTPHLSVKDSCGKVALLTMQYFNNVVSDSNNYPRYSLTWLIVHLASASEIINWLQSSISYA